MLLTMLIGLWVLMAVAGETPIGRALRRGLVVTPAQRLSRVERGQVLLALVLGSVVIGLIWLLQDDGRMLVAFGLPDVVAFATAVDLGAVLDIAVVAMVAAGSVRVRALSARWRRPVAGRRLRSRAVRRRLLRPDNDDEGRPALAA